MKEKYIFREIEKEEVSQMFSMILQRMKWMDKKGIEQWNVTNYEEIYPESYYEEKRQKGEVFVLADRLTKEIVSAAVLKEKDTRWPDEASAIYVHNFVSRIEEKGAGSAFLRCAEEYAVQKGKKYFRLDSSVDNDPLAQYYTRHGFKEVGRCEEGLYKGILRQKEL